MIYLSLAIRLIHPVQAPISQLFGAHPEHYKPFGLMGHEGIDYACKIGTSVYASCDGIVWRAGKTENPWGTRVIVEHLTDDQRVLFYTIYAHMQNVYVSSGSFVREAQVIGTSGNTGNVTGPHLHFCLATTTKNAGYECPASLGKRWWEDPLQYMVNAPVGATRDVYKDYQCAIPIDVY